MTQELLFSRTPGRHWAAVRDGGVLVELRVEDEAARIAAGRIVKARVSKVVAGIQAAFLEVGEDRDAFLHVADLLLPGEHAEGDTVDIDPTAGEMSDGIAGDEEDDEDDAAIRRIRPRRRNSAPRVPIEHRLHVGRDLLVQVAREEIGTKGPRVTCFVSIPGRYLVYMPQWSYRGVSRQITEPEERARLRGILETLSSDGGGFIVRTAGERRDREAFEADAAALVGTWKTIVARAQRATAPSVVYRDFDLPLRILRDTRPDSVERVVFDDSATYESARRYLAPLDPVLESKCRLHVAEEPLFAAEGIDAEIDKALRPRVWLKSGGTIVIEQTEALVSIDVNTGKFVGSRRPEETVLKTNLEAAHEIGRQLRLRDLGGIIVVDFIDMDRADSRRQVLAALEDALRRDRARTKIVGLSELGLVQLTRKRTRPGVQAILTRACPVCQGHARVKSPETLAEEAIVEIRRLSAAMPGTGPITVKAHPDVARAVRLAVQDPGPAVEASVVARLRVEDDPSARPDQFDVVAM